MRIRTIAPVLLISLLVVFPALAQEHPEHPEHPEKSKEVDLDALESAIKAEIAEMADEEGWLPIAFPEMADQIWTLKLDKVHRERLSKIAPDTYFACVDFDEQTGEKIDVDFFMEGASADTLEMQDLSIHKINGVARYHWKEEDGYWKRVDIE